MMTEMLPPSNDDPQRGYITNALAMLLIGVGPAMPLESKLKARNLLASNRLPSEKCENAP